MEPEINCSELCDSFPGQGLDQRPLHDLCGTITSSHYSSKSSSSLSPVLLGVVWTFLSCGLLLIIFFFAFTIRCRKNRIVKMSSPNLNIVTLLGSCLTYSSAYLFGIQDQDALVGNSMETLIQIRLSLLCIGTSLVIGPILGKSWRLYKVFTQRAPDKRVIIKDLQLLGLVAALVIADVILLMTWVLTDPIQCLQILGVSMTVTRRDVSCSLTSTHFCASRYSDVWITLALGCKGLLLLYGAYLAGLTDHVSSPPVNQSLTTMVGVNLVVLAAGLLFVITRYLHSWPNLVFALTSGGIFVCTTTVNCFIFIPQLKQWKAFEEENQTIRRMAKYFSTPSKSFHTQYGEEQNCHAGVEKNSMERLLTEKNAVIESLQEQVNNAKEKLVRLMSAECTYEPPEWAVPPASPHSNDVQVSVSAHSPAAQGPSECLSDTQKHTSAAAQNSQSTFLSVQNLEGSGKDTGPSAEQKEMSNLQDLSDHLNLGCSQKPQVEQSREAERRDQVTIAPCQNLKPGEEGAVPQSQRQLENSEEPPKRLSRVNSVIREKLQEVLQDLDLGPEASLPSSPFCPQQPWKSRAAHSTQKMPPSKELGFSPYMVRRRRAAQQARSHFPGSAPSYMRQQVNRTISGAQSRLNVQTKDSRSLNPQAPNSGIPRPSSKKLSLLTDPQDRPATLESGKQGQAEPQGAGGSHEACPHPLSGSDQTQCPAAPPLSRTLPDLSEQQQRQPLGSTSCPSLPSPCSYLDTESSSSDEFFCHCHRPYCEICFQSSSGSSDSGSSDTDPEPVGGLASWEKLWARSKPIVNFKDDLKPTLV
ncbi:probable G-protein coupled receptor 156 [Talpa occidentalis]|uniref:probable G-protein coupled receptor 156 n=1 Tax=Talpa occidentalis TaxID=50954 RepID=UPI00188E394C|nr:probable G-protein coupled receptor 156 [Talpa occidentalis]XP_037381382.1 probable G-protein coupled receptor 156 [Talpa occidentalis]XP_037381384.1 probable G-protein coupled receptor 156 [Talpa occidentalis]XP_054556511.1 probable G-protein coupled receptor 156 [Talpa occidentalis]